jgi:hypothetical protein
VAAPEPSPPGRRLSRMGGVSPPPSVRRIPHRRGAPGRRRQRARALQDLLQVVLAKRELELLPSQPHRDGRDGRFAAAVAQLIPWALSILTRGEMGRWLVVVAPASRGPNRATIPHDVHDAAKTPEGPAPFGGPAISSARRDRCQPAIASEIVRESDASLEVVGGPQLGDGVAGFRDESTPPSTSSTHMSWWVSDQSIPTKITAPPSLDDVLEPGRSTRRPNGSVLVWHDIPPAVGSSPPGGGTI